MLMLNVIKIDIVMLKEILENIISPLEKKKVVNKIVLLNFLNFKLRNTLTEIQTFKISSD
jgi:hypothetical protein